MTEWEKCLRIGRPFPSEEVWSIGSLRNNSLINTHTRSLTFLMKFYHHQDKSGTKVSKSEPQIWNQAMKLGNFTKQNEYWCVSTDRSKFRGNTRALQVESVADCSDAAHTFCFRITSQEIFETNKLSFRFRSILAFCWLEVMAEGKNGTWQSNPKHTSNLIPVIIHYHRRIVLKMYGTNRVSVNARSKTFPVFVKLWFGVQINCPF